MFVGDVYPKRHLAPNHDCVSTLALKTLSPYFLISFSFEAVAFLLGTVGNTVLKYINYTFWFGEKNSWNELKYARGPISIVFLLAVKWNVYLLSAFHYMSMQDFQNTWPWIDLLSLAPSIMTCDALVCIANVKRDSPLCQGERKKIRRSLCPP